jgi:hypothetical protein
VELARVGIEHLHAAEVGAPDGHRRIEELLVQLLRVLLIQCSRGARQARPRHYLRAGRSSKLRRLVTGLVRHADRPGRSPTIHQVGAG